jgi:hypothetical protein
MTVTIDGLNGGDAQTFTFPPGTNINQPISGYSLVRNDEGGVSFPFGISTLCEHV